MPTIAGIDGCRAGWFSVFEDPATKQLGSKIFPTVDHLARDIDHLDVVAIDVPIGLTERGPRACDVAARKMLGGKRASSVFPAPIRPSIEASTYEEACATPFAAQGKKLPKQAWAIYPKIRELDALIRAHPELSEKVFEVHPEVCFCAWNSMIGIVEWKKSAAGATMRHLRVSSHFGETAYATIRSPYKKGDVADDDILDAFAALWTAERIVAGTAGSLPKVPPRDRCGLPIWMMY